MRIIPVIDLLHNQAVHAVKGERQKYRPVASVLCKSSDPLEIAAAFRSRLGLREIYIADLNAIRDPAGPDHRPVIEALASNVEFRILLDAGVSDADDAARWLESGVHKVVVGSETLLAWEGLERIMAAAGSDRIVFSLDCRDGKILSRSSELATLSPMQALERAHGAGVREMILLDLNRVGSGSGINLPLAAEARAAFPGSTLLAGGGIAGLQEIRELKSLGVEGVLVATALHRGVIGLQQLTGLRR
jgi:phosphoribosylformimino-5-aminoimidazole carboxamide ribotide isomerase